MYLPSGHVTRRFLASGRQGELIVPRERIWRITWVPTDCRPVCTAQLSIEGQVRLGESEEFLLSGQIQVSLSELAGAKTISILTGSKLRLSAELGEVEIVEQVE